MDTARQTLRWSVPGTVSVLLVYSVQLWFHLLTGTITSFAAVRNTGLTVLSILAGIPLGFLLYQVYFWRYSPTGRSAFHILFGRLRVVRVNRGADILRRYFAHGGTEEFILYVSPSDAARRAVKRGALSEEYPYARAYKPLGRQGLQILRIADDAMLDCTSGSCSLCSPRCVCRQAPDPVSPDFTKCPCARALYEQYFYEDWGLAQCCLDVVDTFETGAGIKQEYTTGSDLYHAMGAVRVAVSIAVVGTGLFDVFHHRQELLRSWSLLAAFTFGLAALLLTLWFPLTKTRSGTLASYRERTAASLAWFSRHGRWNEQSNVDENDSASTTSPHS